MFKAKLGEKPKEMLLVEGEVSEEELNLINSVEVNESANIRLSVISEAVKNLYKFSQCEDKVAAVTDAIEYATNKAGIPKGIPVSLSYGFVLKLDAVGSNPDILYSKDQQNDEMIDAVNWLTDSSICFRANIQWTTFDVMQVFITINKNAIQMIYRCPESISFAETAASFTQKTTSRTDTTRIAIKVLYKLLKRDFKEYEDMSCWYSEIPAVVRRKKARKENRSNEVGLHCECSVRVDRLNSFD